MQFIVAFANERIFNIQAKSIVGAKRMANSLRIAIGSDAVYVISRDTGEIWKRERFINKDSSGWTGWMRAENHVSAKRRHKNDSKKPHYFQNAEKAVRETQSVSDRPAPIAARGPRQDAVRADGEEAGNDPARP